MSSLPGPWVWKTVEYGTRGGAPKTGPANLNLPTVEVLGAEGQANDRLAPLEGFGPAHAFVYQTNGREENAGFKIMRDRFNEPNVDDIQSYIEDRAHLLNKALVDHAVWRQSLEQFGRDASLAATWVDHEGQDHVVAINRAYLKAHLTIVRSLMNDLIACGAEGKRVVQSIISLQVSMLEAEETG